MGPGGLSHEIAYVLGQSGVSRTPADVFETVYLVFLILGTLVGLVVIAYMLSKAWRYRDDGERDETEDKKVVRPMLGHLPTGSGGGKKLFVSFGISAVIVLSLIVWTYTALLYVEDTPQEADLTVEVTGQQFSWQFAYENGETSTNTLRLPANSTVRLRITSSDVFHNFGIPDMRVKGDAIPGQVTDKWFVTETPGTHAAHCYELCGAGHSGMDAEVIVMEQDAFQEWYANSSTQASVSGDATGGGT